MADSEAHPSKYDNRLFINAIISTVLVLLFPPFPSQPPRSLEILLLIFLGIVVYHGLFSRRKSDNTMPYASSDSDDESSDDDEPVVVVAKKGHVLEEQTSVGAKTSEVGGKPMANWKSIADVNNMSAGSKQFPSKSIMEETIHHYPTLKQAPQGSKPSVTAATTPQGTTVPPIDPGFMPRLSELEFPFSLIEESLGRLRLLRDEKWIKHYCSSHKILLVGEGDFSFSAALAVAFGSASNITATSLNSHGFLSENYKNAISNVDMLRSMGGTVMHGVDVRIMAYHPRLQGLTFDRIVYNFPFARLSKKSPAPQLRCQQGLVRAFLENAVEMIGEDGEIHITHKTNGNHREWNIIGLANEQGLELVKADDFRRHHYPGYNTKRGFGGDDNFNCYPSKTYIFRLSSTP